MDKSRSMCEPYLHAGKYIGNRLKMPAENAEQLCAAKLFGSRSDDIRFFMRQEIAQKIVLLAQNDFIL